MKHVITAILALSALPAMAQVEITGKEAQAIIDGIKWEKLGKRTAFQLTHAAADCMTLSNYDNKVDFDCAISNGREEVVLDRRELETLVHYTGERLPKEGLRLQAERGSSLCFTNGDCQLTPTLTPEQEKHLYCNMTSHSRYTGSLLEKISGEQQVYIESVQCKAEPSYDFLGNKHTIVTAALKIKGNIGSILGIETFHTWGSLPGVVEEEVACRKILELRGQQSARVERELSNNETTSIRNTDRGLFEKINLRFPSNLNFNGGKSKQTEKGAFCAGA